MTIKILTWNINGIRSIIKKNNIINNKKSKNNTFFNYIQKEDPDIICLNELKICNDKYDKNILSEYKYQCINLSCEKKGYAGVSIYSKIKPILSCKKFESSGRYSMMEFDKFILICVYVMNSGDKLKNLDKRHIWNNLFLNKIKELQKKYNKEIIITGDLNVINNSKDTYNYKQQRNKISGVSDIEMNDFQNFLKETKLLDTWYILSDTHKFTYFTYRFKSRIYNKGMRIDYFLTSYNFLKYIKNIEIKDNIYGSDHLPIILNFNIS